MLVNAGAAKIVDFVVPSVLRTECDHSVHDSDAPRTAVGDVGGLSGAAEAAEIPVVETAIATAHAAANERRWNT